MNVVRRGRVRVAVCGAVEMREHLDIARKPANNDRGYGACRSAYRCARRPRVPNRLRGAEAYDHLMRMAVWPLRVP